MKTIKLKDVAMNDPEGIPFMLDVEQAMQCVVNELEKQGVKVDNIKCSMTNANFTGKFHKNGLASTFLPFPAAEANVKVDKAVLSEVDNTLTLRKTTDYSHVQGGPNLKGLGGALIQIFDDGQTHSISDVIARLKNTIFSGIIWGAHGPKEGFMKPKCFPTASKLPVKQALKKLGVDPIVGSTSLYKWVQ